LYQFRSKSGVSIPYRYDKNFIVAGIYLHKFEVSIPYRYDKNYLQADSKTGPSPVSIPYRYDKNEAIKDKIIGYFTGFNSL